MDLRWKVTKAEVTMYAGGSVTGAVFFSVRDGASYGKLAKGVEECIPFTPSFPITKASLKQAIVDAITAVYAGAKEE